MSGENKSYHFEHAFIDGAWCKAVLMRVGAGGTITSIAADTAPLATSTVFKGYAVPAMGNAHSHAFQRAFAGLAEHMQAGNPDSFWSWRKNMYGFVRHLSPEHTLAIASQLYVEMLKAGYTRVGEFHYVHNDVDGQPYGEPAIMSNAIIEAANVAGIGLSLIPILYQLAGFDGGALAAGQDRFYLSVDDYLRLYDDIDNAEKSIGFHSLRAVSMPTIKEVLAKKLSTQAIHMHIAEQDKEVDDCLAYNGLRPIDFLFDQLDVDDKYCLVHATQVTKQELQKLAKSKAVVALCPSTEANLGDGIFPTSDYLQMNGRFAIGTDSHVTIDPMAELRSLEYKERLAKKSRIILGGASQLWQMAGEGAAQVLGGTGKLTVGGFADVIVISGQHPSIFAHPQERIFDSFIFTHHASLVEHVISGGEWLVKNGKHIDEESILTNYNKTIKLIMDIL